MFTTTNETLTDLMNRFDPIAEHQVGSWRTRCRSASKNPGQTYQSGFRIATTKLGTNADVALLVSNRDNWALVLRVYSGSDFNTELDGKPAAFPIMDPVSVFRSDEEECRDLLLAIAQAYTKQSDDGFGNPGENEVETDDGF